VTKYRAGKRTCTRCRLVFNRRAGEPFKICERCRVHCARCDVELTDENRTKTKPHVKRYLCDLCVAEQVRNTVNRKARRDYDLLRGYGITVNEYDRLLENQGGKCWICGNPPKTVSLSVDHKHERGERRRDPREVRGRVRGLLCWFCNTALEKFDDNPALLIKAAEYLRTLPAQVVLRGEEDRVRQAVLEWRSWIEASGFEITGGETVRDGGSSNFMLDGVTRSVFSCSARLKVNSVDVMVEKPVGGLEDTVVWMRLEDLLKFESQSQGM